MIEGTEKPKIPLKFAKRAARYNEFGYNRPIIAHAQILVHRWGPRTRILVLFLRQTLNQSLVLSVVQANSNIITRLLLWIHERARDIGRHSSALSI